VEQAAASADSLQSVSAASILLIDDEINSIRALSEWLAQQGYRIRRATNSQFALKSALAEPPDLILLDVMMPGLNGFDVCYQLKQAASTRSVPVIFMTALDDIRDKETAFAVGGADYIVKPFQAEEVLMRVRNQLLIAQQQSQLQAQNQQLEQEIRHRQETERRYRAIFENATEGIFQTTLNGQYITVNPALANLYGYDSVEELKHSLSEVGQLYVQPKRYAELQVYLQHYGRIAGAESEVHRKDGSKIWITENIHLVRDEAGNPLHYEGTVQDVTARRQAEAELRQQRLLTEQLLYTVLPHQIARRLQQTRQTIAEQFDNVTVLFADLVGFTQLADQLAPQELVKVLNEIFSTFDQLVEQHQTEKIKTIGDAYLVAAGLPEPVPNSAERIADLALAMQDAIAQFRPIQGQPLQLRIGINTGSVVAGVIGRKKFAYDLWGNTVNIASRMESTGLPGQIQATVGTYQRLQHQYIFTQRGTISVKGKGGMDTYWLMAKR
jgi:PAS domain S-box-containing protein